MSILNNKPFILLLPVAVFLLAGCSLTSNKKTPVPAPSTSASTALQKPVNQPEPVQAKNTEQAKIDYCRRALDSLKQVNPKQAQKYNTSFNSLVSAASQYNSVRDQVAVSTRQAVDSMYQFKAAKLCADIDKELMDSLVTRGENAVR